MWLHVDNKFPSFINLSICLHCRLRWYDVCCPEYLQSVLKHQKSQRPPFSKSWRCLAESDNVLERTARHPQVDQHDRYPHQIQTRTPTQRQRHVLCLTCGTTNTTCHHLSAHTSFRHLFTNSYFHRWFSPDEPIVPLTSTSPLPLILIWPIKAVLQLALHFISCAVDQSHDSYLRYQKNHSCTFTVAVRGELFSSADEWSAFGCRLLCMS